MAMVFLVVAACGNSVDAEREAALVLEAMEEMLGLPDNVLTAPQDEPPPPDNEPLPYEPPLPESDAQTEELEAQPPPSVDLNLPLTVTETTFYFGGSVGTMRITLDGELHGQLGTLDDDEWATIDTDVRSLYRWTGNQGFAVFYIKNDNSLWGFGNNSRGLLGDGTGVDREMPVHILDNVATMALTSSRSSVFALQTDKTLMTWGNGEFSPVVLADNVIDVSMFRAGNWGYFVRYQTANGYIYTIQLDAPELNATRLFPWTVYDGVRQSFGFNSYYINPERSLIQRTNRHGAAEEHTEVAQNIEKIFNYIVSEMSSTHIFLMKSDGSLWSMGENARGELGDGTRVPRPKPVHIADNVAYADAFIFLKQDGTLWNWDDSNPVPQPILENIAVIDGNYVHFQDGSLYVFRSNRSEWASRLESNHQRAFSNVKVPRTITFD